MKNLLQVTMLCALLSGFWSHAAFGQSDSYYSYDSIPVIDSAFLSVSVTTGTDPFTSDTVDVLEIHVDVYRIDSLGSIAVAVYDDFNLLVGRFDYSVSELSSIGAVSGNTITLRLYGIDPSRDYLADALIRTYQEAYLPKLITTYDAP